MALIYSLHSEILKLLYKRATHIVLFLILVFQTFLANIGASQIVSVGIHATPETTPELVEAIPPIESTEQKSIKALLFAQASSLIRVEVLS